jgi:hypothetical protein
MRHHRKVWQDGRLQKLRPTKGADPTHLIGPFLGFGKKKR